MKLVKKILIEKKGDLALTDIKTFYKVPVIKQFNSGTVINETNQQNRM